jgi:hypothetical protein
MLLAMGAVFTALDPIVGGVLAVCGAVHELFITFASDV